MTSPTQDAREPAVAGMAIPPLAAAGWRWPATGPTAPPAPLTVYLVGRISAGAAQARVQTLVKALPAAGIAAERWQRGAMPLARAHCLHLFGAEREHLATLGERGGRTSRWCCRRWGGRCPAWDRACLLLRGE